MRFELNAHKPFFLCGYSFQNELGFQRDGNSFGAGFPIGAGSALLAGESKGDRVPLAVVSKGGDAALAGGIQRRAEPSVAGRIQRNRRFRGTRLCSQSLVCYTFGDRGWRKGVVRAGTSTFRQPQNRRILARHALKFRICPEAKSACSGVGDVAKWRGAAQRGLGMERHHRGSQRDIIPRPAAATLLFVLVTVFRFTL